MDLSALFADKRVEKGTHVVMKSMGLEKGGDFKGWIEAPKFDADGNPAHEIFPKNRVQVMQERGWQLVKQVSEPTAAQPATRKTKGNVE